MLENAIEIAPFVWRLQHQTTPVSTKKIGASLIRQAKFNPRGVARLCFHGSDDAKLQVMLIGLSGSSDFPVHKHLTRDETLVHLVGGGRVTVFENHTEAKREMDFSGGQALSVPAQTWHAMSASKSGLAFLEIRLGPFLSTDTLFLESN